MDLSSSDEQLITAIACGDENAFAIFYQRYSSGIFTYLTRLINDEISADDLLQEVFIAVWQGANRFRGHSQVKTWLYRIAHNQAISWFRRKHITSPFEDAENVESGENPEQIFLSGWMDGQLKQALDTLSPKHREVLELSFGLEMPYMEIAKVIGCPVGTVKSRMSHALQHLGTNLKSLEKLND